MSVFAPLDQLIPVLPLAISIVESPGQTCVAPVMLIEIVPVGFGFMITKIESETRNESVSQTLTR